MLAVAGEFLDCAIYLYPSADAAREGARAGGTGFLVSVPSGRHEHVSYVFAVTNRHVIVGGRNAEPAPVIRLNTISGGLDVIDLAVDNWRTHPLGDDVSAAYIRAADLRDFKYETVPIKRFVTSEDAFREPIHDRVYDPGVFIGAHCFMVGRFITHAGTQQNTPAVRFGRLSMVPVDPIPNDYTGLKQHSFLVEMHSIGGFSGSTVFIGDSRAFHGGMASLLGVDWGHILQRQFVKTKEGEPAHNGAYVDANTGQAAVVPAWKLRELLDGEELTEIRRREDVRITDARNSPMVELDSSDNPSSSTTRRAGRRST